MSYAWDGLRPTRLHFADIPALGGTGIAVSARTAHAAAAFDFAV